MRLICEIVKTCYSESSMERLPKREMTNQIKNLYKYFVKDDIQAPLKSVIRTLKNMKGKEDDENSFKEAILDDVEEKLTELLNMNEPPEKKRKFYT